jgi:hypothetical protein
MDLTRKAICLAALRGTLSFLPRCQRFILFFRLKIKKATVARKIR